MVHYAPELTLRDARQQYFDPGVFTEELLDHVVGEMRQELALDSPAPAATAADRVAFVVWAIVCAVASVLPRAALLAAMVFVVRLVASSA